jgi:response regulator RpfG family c-di-GMP phosphodiesterase
MSEKKVLNVLVVEDEPDLREVIGMFIESEFPSQIIEAGSGNEAIEKIRALGTPDLVVSDFNMPNGNGLVLYNFLRKNDPETPFILATSDPLEMHPEFENQAFTGYVCKPFSDEELYSEIRKLFVQKQTPDLPVTGDYVPLKLSILLKIRQISKALYIKISDTKFVKILPAGSDFDNEVFERIKAKSTDHLYVAKMDYDDLVSKYKKKVLSDMMMVALKAKPSDAIKISATAQDLIQSTVQNFGLNDEAVEMAQKNIQLVSAILENTKQLGDILDILNSDDGEEAVSHALVLSYIVNAIIQEAPLNIPYEGEILSMAAFFHDAFLDGNQIRNEARFIQSLMVKSHLNKSDQEKVSEHIEKMVEKISHWEMAPGDLSTIIIQHHEKPDGTGFPKGLTADQIHDLSACFIVAHEIVELNRMHRSVATMIDEFSKKKSWFESEKFRRFADAALKILRGSR